MPFSINMFALPIPRIPHTHDRPFSQVYEEEVDRIEKWGRLINSVEVDDYIASKCLHNIVRKSVNIFSNENRHFMNETVAVLNGVFNDRESQNKRIADKYAILYAKMRKTYNAFKLLLRTWKIRKMPIRQKTDLYMNELDPRHHNTFQLIQPTGVYYFSLNNLSRIIVDSITNQNNMFIEPLTARNPYTNLPLSKTDLFNIYLKIRLGGIKINAFLQKYYECEFNAYEFRFRYENEMRNDSVGQYLKSASKDDLYREICEMLETYKMRRRIRMDPGFPRELFVDALYAHLELYLLSRYSFCSTTRAYSKRRLKTKLSQFAEANPVFGKRINHGDPSPKYYANIYHPSRYSQYYYMHTHIYQDDNIFEQYVDYGDVFQAYNAEIEEEYEPIPNPPPPPPLEQSQEESDDEETHAQPESDHSEDENNAVFQQDNASPQYDNYYGEEEDDDEEDGADSVS
jgi:hypothetical protein